MISVTVVVKILITRSGQMFQQIALRLHPAGVLYLTLRFTSLKEAYNRSSLPPSHHQARALRALGLLLADGAPTVGGGKTF